MVWDETVFFDFEMTSEFPVFFVVASVEKHRAYSKLKHTTKKGLILTYTYIVIICTISVIFFQLMMFKEYGRGNMECRIGSNDRGHRNTCFLRRMQEWLVA